MARCMALDVGEKRIGIAVSDPLGITAQPLTTLHRIGRDGDLAALAEVAKQQETGVIVVGLPLNMDGTDGVQAQKVRAFAARLAKLVDIPVVFHDERLTSVAAERMLIEGGMRRKARRDVVDTVAAVLILEGYMNAAARKEQQ